MHKILSLCIILILISSFASCNQRYLYIDDLDVSSSMVESSNTSSTQNDEKNDAHQSENADSDDRLTTLDTEQTDDSISGESLYTLITVDDQLYIQADICDMGNGVQGIGFDSLDEFKNKLLNFELDYNVVQRICYGWHDRDDNGIKVFYDFDNLYYPIVPEDITDYAGLTLHQYVYGFFYKNIVKGYSRPVDIYIMLNKDLYLSECEKYNNNLTEYDVNQKYILTSGEKKVTVLMAQTRFSSYYPVEGSDTVYVYRLCIETPNCCAIVRMSSGQKLSDEYILSFDFEKYP